MAGPAVAADSRASDWAATETLHGVLLFTEYTNNAEVEHVPKDEDTQRHISGSEVSQSGS